jgi:hypothetical protein
MKEEVKPVADFDRLMAFPPTNFMAIFPPYESSKAASRVKERIRRHQTYYYSAPVRDIPKPRDGGYCRCEWNTR